jgi:hypothetical protein
MWVLDLLKSLWASYKASRAAKAAAELPLGQAAVDQIHADGATIRAQVGVSGTTGSRPAAK